jgi:hypothetical protein
VALLAVVQVLHYHEVMVVSGQSLSALSVVQWQDAKSMGVKTKFIF